MWIGVVARSYGGRHNGGITQKGLKHYLNQQRDLDLGHKFKTMDSEIELYKGQGTDGCRTKIKIW